jgi:large subunit ribosomal protein L21
VDDRKNLLSTLANPNQTVTFASSNEMKDMFAVVDIAGKQLKVEKDQLVYVHRLAGEAGDAVNFESVLLLADDAKTTIGAPFIKGAAVKATIVGHLKGDKVIVFKKKRRKGYKKTIGHRQALTQIQIESIVA